MIEQDEYDKAFADMSAEPLDIDERQRFEELRRYDTREKKASRQRQRNARLTQAATVLGFDTIDKLCKAIIELSSDAQAKVKKVLNG